jgi:hypothetical protein
VVEGGRVDDTQPTTTTDADLGDVVPEADATVADAVHNELEQPKVQVNEIDVETQRRTEEYEQKEQDINFSTAKTAWKSEHPEETLKHYKNLYIQGKIEKLPWETSSYTQNEEQNENSLFNKLKK